MSDTEDLWRRLTTLERRIEQAEAWMRTCPPAAAIVSHDAVVTIKEAVDQIAATVGDRQPGEPPLADRMRALIDGTAEFDERIKQRLAELARAHRAAVPASAVAGDRGTAIHTLHVERLSLTLDADEDRRVDAGRKMAADLAQAHARARAARRKPITPARIRESVGEDLDVVADMLGLARKAMDDHDGEFEADDALRVRCAAAFFAQNMTREAAEMLAREAAIACKTKHSYTIRANEPGWCPHPWVVDAVMAAAGVGAPLEERVNHLSERAERALVRVKAQEKEIAAMGAELKRARLLIQAVADWRKVAGSPGRGDVGGLMRRVGNDAELFHRYEIPLVDAYDEWSAAVGDAHDGVDPVTVAPDPAAQDGDA